MGHTNEAFFFPVFGFTLAVVNRGGETAEAEAETGAVAPDEAEGEADSPPG